MHFAEVTGSPEVEENSKEVKIIFNIQSGKKDLYKEKYFSLEIM